MEIKRIQSFLATINGVEFNNERRFDVVEYILHLIEYEFGVEVTAQFVEDLDELVVPLLKNSSTKSEIYKEILAKAKELNILATASVMQSMHTKLATSIQIESIQRDLIALSEEL